MAVEISLQLDTSQGDNPMERRRVASEEQPRIYRLLVNLPAAEPLEMSSTTSESTSGAGDSAAGASSGAAGATGGVR